MTGWYKFLMTGYEWYIDNNSFTVKIETQQKHIIYLG